jgi:hypothetical protein
MAGAFSNVTGGALEHAPSATSKNLMEFTR